MSFKATLYVCFTLLLFAVPRSCFPTKRLQERAISSTTHKKPELHSLTDLFKEICNSKPSKVCKKFYNNLEAAVCFARITTITEYKNGPIDINREYEITFENPNIIKEELERESKEVAIQYNVTDLTTGLSEILNFTKVSETDISRLSRNKLLSCGEGSSLTESYFPDTQRLVINLNPSTNLKTSFISDEQKDEETKMCVNCTLNQEDTNSKLENIINSSEDLPTLKTENVDEVVGENFENSFDLGNMAEEDNAFATTSSTVRTENELQVEKNSHDSSQIQQISFKGDIFIMKKILDASAEHEFMKKF